MSQVEVPKVHGWVALAPEADSLTVTKVHGWILLVPGDDSGEQPRRQGMAYGQKIRRSKRKNTPTAPAPTPTPSPTPTPTPTPSSPYQSILDENTLLAPSQLDWNSRPWRVNCPAEVEANLDHSIKLSTNAARFEIRPGDPSIGGDASHTRRSELSGSIYGDPTRLPNGEDLWGAFSTKHHSWSDPAGMATKSGGVYGQIHIGSSFGGSPAVAFRRTDDGLFRVTTRGQYNTSGTVRYEGALSFNDAHDIVYHLVLHQTDGSLRVWVDGDLIVDVEGQSIGHSNAESYWNIGTYFAGGITCPVVAEFANHVYPDTTSLLSRVSSAPDWPTD